MLLSASWLLGLVLLVSAAPADRRNNGSGTGSGRRTAGSKRVKNVQVGPRPYFLIDQMGDSALKRKLQSCSESRASSLRVLGLIPTSRQNDRLRHLAPRCAAAVPGAQRRRPLRGPLPGFIAR